jgi:phage terminase small subunit
VLSDRQQRFCEEYMIDLNATQAYIRAGYSPQRAHVSASQLLAKPSIQKHLRTLKLEVSERISVTRDRVLQEYAAIAFANPKNILGKDMVVRDISELPDEVAASIKKITPISKVVQATGEIDRTWAIEFHDKNAALTALSKHLGLNSDLNEAREAFKKYGYTELKTENGFAYTED